MVNALNLLFTSREIERSTCLYAGYDAALRRNSLPVTNLALVNHDMLADIHLLRWWCLSLMEVALVMNLYFLRVTNGKPLVLAELWGKRNSLSLSFFLLLLFMSRSH